MLCQRAIKLNHKDGFTVLAKRKRKANFFRKRMLLVRIGQIMRVVR